MKKIKIRNEGYVALISILIVGAIGLSVATSLVLLGLGASRSSFVLEQSNQAKALANACVEEALQQVWDDDAYIGMGNLIFGQGNCSYSVSSPMAPKTIAAIGRVGTVVRKISVTVDQFRPYLQVNPWQEVAD